MTLRQALSSATVLFLSRPLQVLPIAVPGAICAAVSFIAGLVLAALFTIHSVHAQSPVPSSMHEAYKESGAVGILISTNAILLGMVAVLGRKCSQMVDVNQKILQDIHVQSVNSTNLVADSIRAKALAEQSIATRLEDVETTVDKVYELVLNKR